MSLFLRRTLGRRIFAKSLPGGLRTFRTSFSEEKDVLGQLTEGFLWGMVLIGGYKVATYSRRKEAEAKADARYDQVFEETKARAVEEFRAKWKKEKTLGVIAASPNEVTRLDGSVIEAVPIQG